MSISVNAQQDDLPGGRPSFEKPFIQPRIGSIEFLPDGVLLNDQFHLPGGRLKGASWPLDSAVDPVQLRSSSNRSSRPNPDRPPTGCEAPSVRLPPGDDGMRRKALACQGTRWLFGEEGYCPEGLEATGRVWLVEGDAVEELHDVIPECRSPVAALIDGDTIWLGTERPIEKYDPFDGGLLQVSLNGAAEPVVVAHLDGKVVTTIALSPDATSLWVASREGLHHLNLSRGEWEHAFFRYRVNAGNKLELYLGDPLPVEEYGLWEAQLTFPLQDRQAFEASWSVSPRTSGWYTFENSPALWPHYRDAFYAELERLEVTPGTRETWIFALLLDLVVGPEGVEGADKAAVVKRTLSAELPINLRSLLVTRLARQDHGFHPPSEGELAEAGIDIERLASEQDFFVALRRANPRAEDGSVERICRRIAQSEHLAALAQTMIDERPYNADVLEICLDHRTIMDEH